MFFQVTLDLFSRTTSPRYLLIFRTTIEYKLELHERTHIVVSSILGLILLNRLAVKWNRWMINKKNNIGV
ncbi:hypothetical protein BDN70DRAFT_873975 [Pholiota conissans]|uniref:Uncharacterized protein n=1 Tax=Pholiota conissans TaxID=109636 RepID=A0A9P5ZB69_9AGAR|nr:hypothetical protein BDN70DRAFT_873975 [Pholiota conissans]